MKIKVLRHIATVRGPSRLLPRLFLGAYRLLRAGLAEPRGPFPGNNDEATAGRYFGLLVHVRRLDR